MTYYWREIFHETYNGLSVSMCGIILGSANLRAFFGAVLETKFTRICCGGIGNQIPLITENLQRHFIFSLGKTKYIVPVMARSVQFNKKAQSYYLNQRFPDLAGWSARFGDWFPEPPRINGLIMDVSFT